MKHSRRWLAPVGKYTGLAAAALITALAVVFAATGCTALGAAPEGERLARAQQSPQWHAGHDENDAHFENPQPMWSDARRALLRMVFGPSPPGAAPEATVPTFHPDTRALALPPASGLRVTWFGHSSALIEIDGARVLIDPLWSERTSPVQWAGPKRWYAPPLALSELPEIDAVVISHDHYDHLDEATIVAMKSWRTVFVVPLGVGAHLSRWGIPDSRIIELDWWQSTRVGSIELTATPARHASGRRGTKSDKTLWAGYALIGARHRAWYSGDTGYHDDLPKIGQRLGPFDVTLIESGQYDADWPDIHLGPELAVEAHRQVGGKVMIPVHWGLIKLANHGWTEPAERVLAAARCGEVEVLVPRPGESVEPTLHAAVAPWWPATPWQSAEKDPIVATQSGQPADRVAVAACVKPAAS